MLVVTKIRDWLLGRHDVADVPPHSPPAEIEAASYNLRCAAQRLEESTERLGEALIEFERVMRREGRNT